MKHESIAMRKAELGTDEDYFGFRFRLLSVSLAVATAFSGVLILASWLGLNDQGSTHLASIKAFFLVDVVLAIFLRGHQDRFPAVAVVFCVAWFLVSLSAVCFLVNNEFRAIWFLIEVMVVYIIFGTVPGLALAALAVVTLLVANRYLPAPFSSNAMVTMIFSICASSAFLHFYTKRFLAYRQRLMEANELLRDLSRHDSLTGVLNARAFYEASDTLARSALRAGTPFTVLFIDLDHFKAINDRHGHEVGDMVLKEVAACLSRNTRRSDVLGRVGGEEFMMLLPDTDLAGAKMLAEKLRQQVEALALSVWAQRIPVTVSIGMARNRPGEESIAAIKREADQAMYRAKAAGRNRVMGLDDSVAT